MNLFAPVFYLLAIFLFNFSFYIAEGKLSYSIFRNNYALTILFSGLLLTLANFKLKEIIQALKTFLNNKAEYNSVKSCELIINSLWKNLLNSSLLGISVINIILFYNAQRYAISDFFIYNLSLLLYLFILKMFIFIPVNLSLDKKLIYMKKYQSKSQSVPIRVNSKSKS